MFALSNFQNTFLFANLKARRSFNLPFCCFLSNISYHDRFFSYMFDWNLSKIQDIWKIQHSSATYSPYWNYEFFSFCKDHQIIYVICFGLGTKLYYERYFHAWCYSTSHIVYFRSISWMAWCTAFGRFLNLLAWLYLKKLRVWWDNFHRSCHFILISKIT